MDGVIQCGICGHKDSGNYCSNCGSPLMEDSASSLEILKQLVFKIVIQNWINYFRTLYFVVVRPSWFFSNYFSNPSFISTNRVSPYPNFFAHNFIFTNVVYAFMHMLFIREVLPVEILNALGLGDFRPYALFEETLYNLLDVVLFFLGSLALHAYFALGLRRKENGRRIAVSRSIVGTVYCQAVLVFTMPYQAINLLVALDVITEFGAINAPWTILSVASGIVFSLVYTLHIIPVCFNAAHGIRLAEARAFSFGFNSFLSQIVSRMLRFVLIA